jgi:hypothetical protein
VTPPARQISFGGLSFSLSGGAPALRFEPEDAHRGFLVSDAVAAGSTPAVRVSFAIADTPAFEGEAIFRSSATWSILARGSDRALDFRDPAGDPLYVAEFRPGLPHVTVTCSPRLLGADDAPPRGVLKAPFGYPLDQVLTMYLLADQGVVLHAAGALVHGKGVALAGASGAGKSTLMRIAAGRTGWQPLSDDRVILRVGGGVATLYGTPWPGEGQVAERASGGAAALLFLEQAPDHQARPLTPRETLARLLPVASLPWYDRDYVGNALDACERIAELVPASVLSFRPKSGAIRLVERVLSGTA